MCYGESNCRREEWTVSKAVSNVLVAWLVCFRDLAFCLELWFTKCFIKTDLIGQAWKAITANALHVSSPLKVVRLPSLVARRPKCRAHKSWKGFSGRTRWVLNFGLQRILTRPKARHANTCDLCNVAWETLFNCFLSDTPPSLSLSEQQVCGTCTAVSEREGEKANLNSIKVCKLCYTVLVKHRG